MKLRFSSLQAYLLLFSLLFILFSVPVGLSALQPLDHRISSLLFFKTLRSPIIFSIMLAVSNIETFMPLIGIVTAMILWRFGYKKQAVLAITALMATTFVNFFKLVYRQPCPGPEIGEVRLWSYIIKEHLGLPDHSPYCYPSGHVGSYVVFWGYLAHLVHRFWRNHGWEWFIESVIVLLLLLIGLSRIYLGAHWFSDVLGGYLIGVSALLLLIMIGASWTKASDRH